MSVRVVARIRPLLKNELESDIIVKTDGTSVMIPSVKNDKEKFTFAFNSVLDQDADQAKMFTEVMPTIKHLFQGNDVTIFAYGVTGTGKTHTMRGGKAVAERGIIPRLLTAIYRRGKDIEKKSDGQTTVTVDMSYYEIYNDKVFDLFEPPEKRSLSGLPLREHDKKTIVVGLTEKRIATLKEFEVLYDNANANRTTFATKLNAHSSRSHAIMGVRVTIENKATGEARQGTMSAIDLAGSEDNRRTANDKERMTESASINKSLFVLAQCVEAISKKQARIPYRESKMTRILSLGQNNGMTVMILNIAPTKQYHQDTISSLNFANRTKKIEIKEAESNVYKIPPVKDAELLHRQPLRPLNSAAAAGVNRPQSTDKSSKPTKNEGKPKQASAPQPPRKPEPLRTRAPTSMASNIGIKKDSGALKTEKDISALVERKVEEILAAKAKTQSDQAYKQTEAYVNEQVNKRLEELEKRINSKQTDERAEGLSYLLLAKQHRARGEIISALKMYELALPYFPDNPKLLQKIAALKEERNKRSVEGNSNRNTSSSALSQDAPPPTKKLKKTFAVFADTSQPGEPQISLNIIRHAEDVDPFELPPSNRNSMDDISFAAATAAPAGGAKSTGQKRKKAFMVYQEAEEEMDLETAIKNTPRTHRLLAIINSEDVAQIKLLKGVGPKRAVTLAQHVKERKDAHDGLGLASLADLAGLPGIGQKVVETMRVGVGEEARLPTKNPKSLASKAVKEIGGFDIGMEDAAPLTTKAYDSGDEYVPTPRRRSKTLMSKKEAYNDALRDFVEARNKSRNVVGF